MKTETIEQKAIKLISKYSPWLKENLLIEEHLYEFDDVAGLIELAIAEEREVMEKYRKACKGLPDGAIDGGWTALGMSSYAKRLEDALNEILCLDTDQLANAYIISGEVLALRFFPMYASAVEVRE
jgi:hypothetical protein